MKHAYQLKKNRSEVEELASTVEQSENGRNGNNVRCLDGRDFKGDSRAFNCQELKER